jgi:hypothetical protein
MERLTPRKIKEYIPEEQTDQDLKRYRGAALNVERITGAVIISRDDIYVDPRATYDSVELYAETVVHGDPS